MNQRWNRSFGPFARCMRKTRKLPPIQKRHPYRKRSSARSENRPPQLAARFVLVVQLGCLRPVDRSRVLGWCRPLDMPGHPQKLVAIPVCVLDKLLITPTAAVVPPPDLADNQPTDYRTSR